MTMTYFMAHSFRACRAALGGASGSIRWLASRSACDLQQVGVDRQGADALGRGDEDRVRHRRADGGGRGLADAAGGLGASDQMCFDHRRLVDPERAIGVKIALLHPPVLERDRAVERRGQAEERSTLDLGLDRVRIDYPAAIDGADDTMDLERTVGHDLDLCHLREVTAKGELDRDAAAAPWRQRPAPTGLLRRQRQYGERARIMAEQRFAIGDGI